MQSSLGEAEETIESLNQKVNALEKCKQRLATELEDKQGEVERYKSLAISMAKKQKQFDKIVLDWKT